MPDLQRGPGLDSNDFDYGDLVLPDFTESEVALRSLPLSFENCVEYLESKEGGMEFLSKQGSHALRGVDAAVAGYIEETVAGLPIADELKMRAVKAVGLKDWSGIKEGSAEQFVLREMIMKVNVIKLKLIQKLLKESPETGFNPVAKAEYAYLAQAFPAYDMLFMKLAMEMKDGPISSDERVKLGLNNEWAVVREIGGKYVEVPMQEAYPMEIGDIVLSYEELIRSLNVVLEGSEDESLRNLAERKIVYYQAVLRAFETGDLGAWQEADALLPGQVRDINDVIHIHPIEVGYMQDRVLRSPEIGLRAPDLAEVEAQELSADTKARMIRSFEGPYFQDSPAIATTLPLLYRSNAALRHFLGGGAEMDMKPAGQILPNEDAARVRGGIDSSLDMDTVKARFPLQVAAFKRVFGEDVYKSLCEPRINFNEQIGGDVAGHELGHAMAVMDTTRERLGGPSLMNTRIEEWKATVGGLVGNYLVPFYEGERSFEDLENWVVKHIMGACRYSSVRNTPFIAAYFRKSMMLMKVAEESGILLKDAEAGDFPWKIDLDKEKVLQFMERVFAQYKEVVRLYGEGDATQLSAFLQSELQVTDFLSFVCERNPVPNPETCTPEQLVQLPEGRSVGQMETAESIKDRLEAIRTDIHNQANNVIVL